MIQEQLIPHSHRIAPRSLRAQTVTEYWMQVVVEMMVVQRLWTIAAGAGSAFAYP